MSEKTNRKITFPQGGSFFNGLTLRIKLILRLMGDSRVSPLLKILPVGSLLYFILPDIAPGPIDDAAIIWLATTLFVELCPPGVVDEHLHALNATRKALDNYEDPKSTGTQDEVIDGEFVEKK